MNWQLRNLRVKGLICLALGLITLALYLPSVRHKFLDYDDQQYVTENLHVRAGLTGSGLVWAFGFRAGNWHPLTWMSHMLDCQLYDLRPAGHHLTNALLHAANTLLLFLVLSRLTGAVWRSAAVAALFAWHPLHVESVAWVAERKDVLSAFFFMLTLGAYSRYAGHSQARNPKAKVWYGLVLVCFALGLMSKPMLVTLPFVLLLLDYWPLRRWPGAGTNRRPLLPLLLEKVPLLALAALGCVLTLLAQQPAMVSTRGLPIPQRAEHALVAYLHYLGSLFAPQRMAIYYPYDRAVPVAQILLACIVLAGVTAVAVRLAARRPYLATGWLWFLGMLVPVIGLVQVGDQAWADRYTYLPSVGLFIAVVWALGDWATGRTRRIVVGGLAAAAGVALLAGTSVQLRYWKDTGTLFEHAAQVTRNNPLAATLLGSLRAREGKLDEAVQYYQTALRYVPGYPEAHFFLGNALDKQGKLDEAIAEYKKALWFKPTQEQTHIFLGAALGKQKKYDQAAAQYVAALKVNPDSPVAHNNLARLLHTQGRFDEAIAHYTAAIEADPGLAQAHNNLGILLLQKGRAAEGIAQLREALRLKPGDPESQLNLAQALVEQGNWADAADLFARTITPATTDSNARCQFAIALAHLGRTREAMSQYASALLLQPDFPAALDGLSWILATAANPQFRNGTEAVRMASRACELTGRKDPAKLKTLAAAYAEAGQFAEAAATAQTAQDLAAQAARTDLADECRRMLEQFQAAKPWRVK